MNEDSSRLLQRYRAALGGRRLPCLAVDLDHLESNAQTLLRLSPTLPIRVASKSIRSVALLRHIAALSPRFQGVMAYSAAEAAFLADVGFRDILIGYPSVESSDLEAAARAATQGVSMTFMVCETSQLASLKQAAAKAKARLQVCVDLNQATPVAGLFFGVRRSAIETPSQALSLAREIIASPELRFFGFMGYDAQIAGVPDLAPGRALENMVISQLKKISWRRLLSRRKAVIEEVRRAGITYELFNGGGTGSLNVSVNDPALTEVTAGSGFYAPTLFDHYRDLALKPAMFFALPVTRAGGKQWITCHGGGYPASGEAGESRLSKPYLPEGLALFRHEGGGEVQTPLSGRIEEIKIGDAVFFRHAKAGEICERFNEIHLIRGNKITETVNTYRGDGVMFL
jgi:D-serine deaminase-like pyridoxal phosphate-dependent protein